MTMKNDTKTEEKLTCCLKIDKRNLTNFDSSTQKSKKLCFNGLLVTKIYNVWAKKVQRRYLSWHQRVMQNLKKKLTCGLKNDMRNLANFHQSTWKCQNWDFVGILLSKVEKVWPYNLQLCMTMKNNAKFEEELTCHFKTDMRNLTNFDARTWKPKKLAL